MFGEDGLDPAMMEAKDGSVVDFTHVLEHAKNTQNKKTAPIPADTIDVSFQKKN